MKQLNHVLSILLFSLTIPVISSAQYTAISFTQLSQEAGARFTGDQPEPAGINSISASLDDKKITLAWSVPEYAPAAGFIIERSEDGEHFELIGSDATATIHTEKRSFSFTDRPGKKLMNQGDIFYRVGVAGEHNEYQYSKPILVRVKSIGQVDYISVFPHPRENDLNLVVSLKENGYMVARLTNEQDQELMNQKGRVSSGAQQFSLAGTSQLKPGIYWLELMVDSRQALKMKLIKE